MQTSNLSWDSETISIGSLLQRVNTINVDPLMNRPSISPKFIGDKHPSKFQGIIASIFSRFDLGELTVVRTSQGETFPYEALDGAHRIRAIKKYFNNEFPTHRSSPVGAKYYRELSEEQKDIFNSFSLRLVTYKNMTNSLKGIMFRLRNGGTPVNHMEMLNAYGNIPIANFIRSTARVVVGENSDPHELFKANHVKNKQGTLEEKHIYVKFENTRLDHDERVARITYMMYAGQKLSICDKEQLEQMYQDSTLDEAKVAKVGKKVIECLDFMMKIARVRRNLKKGHGLTGNEFTMLYRWYIYFNDKYKSFKVVDAEAFYKSFDSAMNKFIGSDKDNLISGQYQESPKHSPRLIHEAFAQHLGLHNSLKKIEKTCEWLTNEGGFDPVKDGSVEVLDTRRTFPRNMIEQKLSEQDYTCWVDGSRLSMDDAQGAHIIPHSKGGKSNYDNLVVVHKKHNISMSDMNAYDYRDSIVNKNKVA